MNIKACSFKKTFSRVFEHCAEYSTIRDAVSTNSFFAKSAIDTLVKLSKLIQKRLYEEKPLVLAGLRVAHSKGSGKYPRVPWIGITRQGETVSTSRSVSICFGRGGNGAVIGLMLPAHSINSSASTLIRSPITSGIDVDGDGNATKYNDRFINPIELPSVINEEAESIMVEHLIESISLLRAC